MQSRIDSDPTELKDALIMDVLQHLKKSNERLRKNISVQEQINWFAKLTVVGIAFTFLSLGVFSMVMYRVHLAHVKRNELIIARFEEIERKINESRKKIDQSVMLAEESKKNFEESPKFVTDKEGDLAIELPASEFSVSAPVGSAKSPSLSESAGISGKRTLIKLDL